MEPKLKHSFYSIRVARITVAIMDCGLGVARGIAICSVNDQWWKKRGQAIAAGRMFAAVNCCNGQGHYFGCPINKLNIECMVDRFIGTGDYPIFKSSFEPEYVARNRFEESIMRKWGVKFKPIEAEKKPILLINPNAVAYGEVRFDPKITEQWR